MKNMIKSSKGFTLIEVMVVATIIAILAPITILNYLQYKNKKLQKKPQDTPLMQELAKKGWPKPKSILQYESFLPVMKDIVEIECRPQGSPGGIVVLHDSEHTFYYYITDLHGCYKLKEKLLAKRSDDNPLPDEIMKKDYNH